MDQKATLEEISRVQHSEVLAAAGGAATNEEAFLLRTTVQVFPTGDSDACGKGDAGLWYESVGQATQMKISFAQLVETSLVCPCMLQTSRMLFFQ